MEKKYEFTFNKIILKNIYKSFIIAVILFVIFDWAYMYLNHSNFFHNSSQFKGDIDYEEYFVVAIKDIFSIEAMLICLMITFPIWIISIINHFVKFKIK